MRRDKQGADKNKSSPSLPIIRSFGSSKPFLLPLLIVLIVTFSLVSSIFTHVHASEITQEEIEYELVRGYFNEITFESAEENTDIELTHPDTTETYNWTYQGGEWSGKLNYLDEDNTSYNQEENSWTVKIAIDQDVPTGDDWTLTINGEDAGLRVVTPETGLGITGTLTFDFEPYSGDSEDTDSLSLTNAGNVPMSYELDYTDQNIIYEAEKDIIGPGESVSFTFTYQYSTTGPEMFSHDISVTAKYLGYFDSSKEGNIGVNSQAGFGITANVIVGYENYEQENLEDYSVQYERSKSVEGDSSNKVTFYVYPNEDIYISFNSENVTFEDEDITIIPRDSNGEELDEIDFDPTDPLSSDYGEVKITVEFKSDNVNNGFIELLVKEGASTDAYKTDIQISQAAPEPGEEEISFVEEQSETITLGVVLLAPIVAFGVARILLNKKKEDKG